MDCTIMKTTFTLSLALCASILFVSCKTSSPTAPANNYGTPTPVGTPIGSASTATIDASGGTLMSPDGRLELIIPANALSTATPISIQPVTNECLGGAGVGYSLTPNGQTFNQPVTLRFHYDDSDRAGTDIHALEVATQRDDRIWYGFKSMNLDSAASTLSVLTSHFSLYSLLERFSIDPWAADVEVNKTQGLTVKFVSHATPADANDELVPLTSTVTYRNEDG